jgi:hypothetical protein
MKPMVLIFSLLLTATGPAAIAQSQQCLQLTEQLLKELDVDAGQEASMEAKAETQRRLLRSRGCDPQNTGYDIGVEGIRLNRQLDPGPEEKRPFRLDQLFQIQY